jgi:hypothetical protein
MADDEAARMSDLPEQARKARSSLARFGFA